MQLSDVVSNTLCQLTSMHSTKSAIKGWLGNMQTFSFLRSSSSSVPAAVAVGREAGMRGSTAPWLVARPARMSPVPLWLLVVLFGPRDESSCWRSNSALSESARLTS